MKKQRYYFSSEDMINDKLDIENIVINSLFCVVCACVAFLSYLWVTIPPISY